jgi:hypothetical protein
LISTIPQLRFLQNDSISVMPFKFPRLASMSSALELKLGFSGFKYCFPHHLPILIVFGRSLSANTSVYKYQGFSMQDFVCE